MGAKDLMDTEDEVRRLDAEDVPVQLNVKVPWHYREQLVRMAKEKGLSLNRLVVNGLVRTYPPDRR